MRVARPVRRADRGSPPSESRAGRPGPTPTPTSRPGKAWLYLASVLDLASRHLLGWSMGDHHDARLVCDALESAVATRGRQRMNDTIFHTDRGAEGGFSW
ncbi:MAG: DDE-type integrase/transposase/recombinase, partial [Actinomycetota bacterium]